MRIVVTSSAERSVATRPMAGFSGFYHGRLADACLQFLMGPIHLIDGAVREVARQPPKRVISVRAPATA